MGAKQNSIKERHYEKGNKYWNSWNSIHGQST